MEKKEALKKIRGWFPQEPKLQLKPLSVENLPQRFPQIINHTGPTRSATKSFLASGGIFGAAGCFNYAFCAFISQSISAIGILWIFVGLIVGSLAGVMVAKRQLSQLTKENHVPLFGRSMMLEMLVPFLFMTLGFVLALFWIESIRSVFVSASLVVIGLSYCTKSVLFLRYERQKNVSIRQQKPHPENLDMALFALPREFENQGNAAVDNSQRNYWGHLQR